MTTPSIDDGGPAFPAGTNAYSEQSDNGYGGMTLRDYFAATNDECVRDLSVTQAVAVMGTKPPAWSVDTDHENNIKCVRWWAECFARMRYLHADAMLAARKETRP